VTKATAARPAAVAPIFPTLSSPVDPTPLPFAD
jgi:hypothetical protein